MRKKFYVITLLLLFVVLLTFPQSVKASTDDKIIFDFANLLSTEDEEQLIKLTEKFEKYNMTAVFLTTNDTLGKTSMTYSDDFYDTHDFKPDGILFMIDMDNREVYINTVGKCINLLSDEYLYQILSAASTHASAGEYCLALTRMCNSTYKEIENQLSPFFAATKFSFSTVIIMIIITTIVLIIFITKHNRANRKTPTGQYIGSTFTVNHRNAIYMGCRHEVLPNYYSQQNKNGDGPGGGGFSGGGIHTSSRGVSHGGGGHRF